MPTTNMPQPPTTSDSLNEDYPRPKQASPSGTVPPVEPSPEPLPKRTPLHIQYFMTAISVVGSVAMSIFGLIIGSQVEAHIRGQVKRSLSDFIFLLIALIVSAVGCSVIILHLIFLRFRYEAENHEVAFERAKIRRIREYIDAWERGVRDPRELGVEGYQNEALRNRVRLQAGRQDAMVEQERREDRRRRIREARELQRRLEEAYMLFGEGTVRTGRSDRRQRNRPLAR